MEHFKMFINGEQVEAKKGGKAEAIDPGTGKPIATFAYGGKEDADAAVDAARDAFDSGVWSDMDPKERSRILIELSDLLYEYLPMLANWEALDSGGLITRTSFDVITVIGGLRNLSRYAAHEFKWKEDLPKSRSGFVASMNYQLREPLGVCVGIVPWNFPFLSAMYKCINAMAMGNTVVVKPASDTSVSMLVFEEALKKSRIPKGVMNIVTGPGSTLGRALCLNPKVDKIAFTGSTEVGIDIMTMAAQNITKVHLELGGKSPNIICEDADLDFAVDGAMCGTFVHSGQVCESGTRLLVHKKIYKPFLDKIVARTKSLRVGYQMDPAVQFGPIVSQKQLDTIMGYIEIGKKEGAKLMCGGGTPKVKNLEGGFYCEPTIFADVDNAMRVAQEEIFGPVLCVIPYDNYDEAIKIANDTPFGLAGGVFSRDMGLAEKLATKIKAGTIWINDWHNYGDTNPFGGYKKSGFGREWGAAGLEEYTQIKRVAINPEAEKERSLLFGVVMKYPEPPKSFHFNNPTKLSAGPGYISSIKYEMNLMNVKKGVIITDKGIKAAGIADKVAKAMGDYCVGIFDKVVENSGYETIDEAVEFCKSVGAECLVSVGGGSSIDTAKVTAVTLSRGGKAIDNITMFALNDPITPHIAIPTTAGTGSEMTNMAVIMNRAIDRKINLAEYPVSPDVAILDPLLTIGLPAKITAATGMDALSHAIETIICTRRNMMSKQFAMEAIRLVARSFRTAVSNGTDVDARMDMLLASANAGIAINMSATCLGHAMAHAVGAKFHSHHGALCGIFLPHVMRFCLEVSEGLLAEIAEAFGVNTRQMTKKEAAAASVDCVVNLMKDIGHPLTLTELGVPADAIPDLAVVTLSEFPTMFNPIVPTLEQCIEIYKGCM
ncbi:MAG TPA: aldehyde dehydrogenase family protein [Deltaproteobacteria bacterium]|nr:aldehyde dehydrogenase family protein [Deltaproteobacteria bacterium]HXK47582.1 aldehyde dehydrogenase family protein [Deltaproteobacteria bacterium]